MAEVISFSTGEKTYSLNDKVEVSFNPADMAFMNKLYSTGEALNAKNEEYRAKIETGKGAELFDIAKQCDEEMRLILDGLFNKPICADLFPDVYVMAVGEGFPLWANLLYALVENMDASLTAEKTKAQQRIRKYSAKYKR